MPEISLDQVFHELTGVLKAITHSESLWLSRLQDLRPAPTASNPWVVAPPAVAQRTWSDSSDPSSPRETALEAVRDEPDRITTPAKRDEWPATSGGELVELAVGKRDYDYFAELDEKLSNLGNNRGFDSPKN